MAQHPSGRIHAATPLPAEGEGPVAEDAMWRAERCADYADVAIATWWRSVRSGRMPKPFYPTAGNPRWSRAEVVAAVRATRTSPSTTAKARRISAGALARAKARMVDVTA